MAAATDLTIRPARLADGDVELFLRAHDGAVMYLCSIGSAQWGTKPFSERPDAVPRFTALVTKSEEQEQRHAESKIDPSSASEPWVSAFVAEARALDDSAYGSARGVAAVSDYFPSYIVGPASDLSPRDAASSSHEARDFLYLDDLVSIRLPKGETQRKSNAGTALLAHAKALVRARGKRFLYADCYNAPPYGLVEYYKKQGFTPIATFSVVGKHVPDVVFPGALLCMEMPES